MFDPLDFLASATAFALGACIGSFLNVCIYRWPIGLSVNKPTRSFCPGCQRDIPMQQNIPLFSWLLLGGRCAGCKGRIPFRYFAVELLTALVFLGLWRTFPPEIAVPLILLAISCIVTVFVDFEHYIIPHQVTWGFLPLGLLASAVVPSMHFQGTWWGGLVQGLIGAATGLGVLWVVVELGKRAFGRKIHKFSPAVPWELREVGDSAELVLDGDVIPWDDMFGRKTDRLTIETTGAIIDGKPEACAKLAVAWDHLELQNPNGKARRIKLADVHHLSGLATRVIVPREAMGMGDVYFLGMAGAFIGWQGALFTVFAASVYGSVFGLGCLLAGRRGQAGVIPFGPWLVAGVWSWIFAGPDLLAWYFGLLGFAGGTP